MFEGTDLNVAYGFSDDAHSGYMDQVPPKPVVQQKPSPGAMSFGGQQQAPPTQSQQVPQTQSFNAGTTHAVDLPYNPPIEMYTQGPPPKTTASGPGFWDRIAMKKYEVMKLVGLSLVILLAIAIDKVANHYLTQYLADAYLSNIYEFLVRIMYPVAVLLVLWILKAL
jgi:hypothetical protein